MSIERERNSFVALASGFSDIRAEKGFHKPSNCQIPGIAADDASYLEIHASVMLDQITGGIQAVGELMTEYPAMAGNAAVLMPQLGALLRVLGDAAEYAASQQKRLVDAQFSHEQMKLKGVQA